MVQSKAKLALGFCFPQRHDRYRHLFFSFSFLDRFDLVKVSAGPQPKLVGEEGKDLHVNSGKLKPCRGDENVTTSRHDHDFKIYNTIQYKTAYFIKNTYDEVDQSKNPVDWLERHPPLPSWQRLRQFLCLHIFGAVEKKTQFAHFSCMYNTNQDTDPKSIQHVVQ